MFKYDEIKNLTDEEKRIIFESELKAIQKAHLPVPCRRKDINPDWKKEWEPFIKYDFDWDWAYLLDMILYKLEKMRLNLLLFSSATDEWPQRIEKELNEVIELGHKIQNFDYNEGSYNFSIEHTTPITVIYKNNEEEPNKLGQFIHAKEIARIAEAKRGEGEYSIFGNKNAKKWCKNHHIRLKDVHFAYTADWDSKENYKTWLKMNKNEYKQEQKEVEKFFLLIAKYLKGWWD